MQEAQRTAPTAIYPPQVHAEWEALGVSLQATFTTFLHNIRPADAPVLLLATSDVCQANLPKELFHW